MCRRQGKIKQVLPTTIAMDKNIDIISHTVCGTQMPENQEEIHPTFSKELFRRGNLERSDAGNTQADHFNRAAHRKVTDPIFIEKPLMHEMAIVKKRTNSLKQSLMRDLFMGHGFVYPFKVCIAQINFDLQAFTNRESSRDLLNY